MRSRTATLLACLVAFLVVTPAVAGGNANFLLGLRSLDEDDWEPIEDQGVFGATVDFAPNDWPVHLAIGFYVSGDEEDFNDPLFGSGDLTGSIAELSFGVLKAWEPAKGVHPYVGAGLSAVRAEVEIDVSGLDEDDDDTSGGFYGQGGVYWRLGQRFNIGLDVRFLAGTDIELFGSEGDADYLQAGLLLGWGWGS